MTLWTRCPVWLRVKGLYRLPPFARLPLGLTPCNSDHYNVGGSRHSRLVRVDVTPAASACDAWQSSAPFATAAVTAAETSFQCGPAFA